MSKRNRLHHRQNAKKTEQSFCFLIVYNSRNRNCAVLCCAVLLHTSKLINDTEMNS